MFKRILCSFVSLTSTDLKMFKHIFIALMIVMLSETDGWIDSNEKQENPPEKYGIYLLNHMKGMTVGETDLNFENIDDDIIDENYKNVEYDDIKDNQIRSFVRVWYYFYDRDVILTLIHLNILDINLVSLGFFTDTITIKTAVFTILQKIYSRETNQINF